VESHRHDLEPVSQEQRASLPDARLARRLVLDELFDLSLYQRLRRVGTPELTRTLDELIEVEKVHFAFWQDFFSIKIPRLDVARRCKLWFASKFETSR